MTESRTLREPSKKHIMLPSDILSILVSCCDEQTIGEVIKGVVEYDLYGIPCEVEGDPAAVIISRALCDRADVALADWRTKMQRFKDISAYDD